MNHKWYGMLKKLAWKNLEKSGNLVSPILLPSCRLVKVVCIDTIACVPILYRLNYKMDSLPLYHHVFHVYQLPISLFYHLLNINYTLHMVYSGVCVCVCVCVCESMHECMNVLVVVQVHRLADSF